MMRFSGSGLLTKPFPLFLYAVFSDDMAKRRLELLELLLFVFRHNLAAACVLVCETSLSRFFSDKLPPRRSSHGHRYKVAGSLGAVAFSGVETKSLLCDWAFEHYFYSCVRRSGHDFLYQSLLAGAIPSLDVLTRHHAKSAVTSPLGGFGFHFARMQSLLLWLSTLSLPDGCLFHLSVDETSCLPWTDFSATTRSLVGLVVPDQFISSVDLRPCSVDDVRKMFSLYPSATKLCAILLCPLVIHRPPFVLAVFGSTADVASSSLLLSRLRVARHLVRVFTQGACHVVSYGHDASSGEHGATKSNAAAVIASSAAAAKLGGAEGSAYMQLTFPRPAISCGTSDAHVQQMHGRVSRANLTAATAARLARDEPELRLAWPILSAPSADPLPFIDAVHIGKCLFSALRSSSLSLRMGTGVASTSELLVAFDSFQPALLAEDHFGVLRADLLSAKSAVDDGPISSQRPVDPMRFPPTERFCSSAMCAALTSLSTTSPNFMALLLYQKVIRYGALSTLQPELLITDRIHRLAWAFYFLSGWRQWLQANHFDLRKHFVFHSHLTSILLNLQSLMFLSTWIANAALYGFLATWLLGSQANEDIFRRAREVHGLCLFSPLQFLRRIALLELHSCIRARRRGVFAYPPRQGSTSLDELHHAASFPGSLCSVESCSPNALRDILLRAREEAHADLARVGITLLEQSAPAAAAAAAVPQPVVALAPDVRERLDKEELDSDDDLSDGDEFVIFSRGTRQAALRELERTDVFAAADVNVRDEAESLKLPVQLANLDARVWAGGLARARADASVATLSPEDRLQFTFGHSDSPPPAGGTERGVYLQPPANAPAGSPLTHISSLCAQLSGRPTSSKDRTRRVQDALVDVAAEE
jgi:hypothetical protein